jgi:hypothetical protein
LWAYSALTVSGAMAMMGSPWRKDRTDSGEQQEGISAPSALRGGASHETAV